MSDNLIFREIDEELRSERMRNLWRRFAPFIIGGAVLVVVAVAVNEGWRWWRASTAATASDQYYAALDLAEQGDLVGAQTALEEIAADGPSGYGVLAAYRSAALLAQQGDTEAAIAAFDALANAQSEPRLRELALVQAAYLAIDTGGVDAVSQRVGTIAESEGPMQNPAREALGLAHYRAGDVEAARTRFEAVANHPGVPQQMQARMMLYLGHLAAQGVASEIAVDSIVEPLPADPVELLEGTETAPMVEDMPAVEDAPAPDAPLDAPAEQPAPAEAAPEEEAPLDPTAPADSPEDAAPADAPEEPAPLDP